jgi:hypothetical protein
MKSKDGPAQKMGVSGNAIGWETRLGGCGSILSSVALVDEIRMFAKARFSEFYAPYWRQDSIRSGSFDSHGRKGEQGEVGGRSKISETAKFYSGGSTSPSTFAHVP